MASFGLQIPEAAYGGIAALSSLSDEDFQELLKSLSETSPALQVAEFSARVATKVKISVENVEQIIRAVLPLYSLRSTMEVSTEQFMEIFLEAVDDIPFQELELEEAKSILDQRVPRLLEAGHSLGVISKARFIMNEHYRILSTSHIYTEVRPIFKDDPEELPAAAVILHKLKIDYVENNDKKEFYVTLDAKDLEDLREVINRAEKKARSLHRLLSSTPMTILEVDSHE